MKNIVQKLFLAGMGAFSLTKNKAEEVVDEMVKKGQVDKDEAQSVIDDLINKGEEEREAIKNTIREELDKFKQELDVPTSQEFNELSERVSRLEEKILSDNSSN